MHILHSILSTLLRGAEELALHAVEEELVALPRPARVRRPEDRDLGDLYAASGQTLQGSFSAVSKPIVASKYSLELGSI